MRMSRKGRVASGAFAASASGGRGGGARVLVVKWGGCVQDQQGYDAFGHGFAGFCDANGFGFVGSLAEACSINEFHGNAVEGDALGHEVASGAGGCGDDGPIALDQTIENG